MFVIKLKSYTNFDKINITKKYIIPNLLKDLNLDNKIIFTDDIIEFIINTYTYEGGIRKLKKKT